jgi:ATP-dependent protease HslVU (ClpYQ) peptidase subunit
MTCIVGLIEEGKVYMGGDSAGVGNLRLAVRKDLKVFKLNEFIIGYTSSFRMGQLLRFKFIPPLFREDEKDLYEYMCTDFIDGVRRTFKTGGYAKKANEIESGGTFLVGIKGRLFEIEDDYQVAERITPYVAIGCGMDLALGCLYGLKNIPALSPYIKVETALLAAQEFSAGVRAPFTIIKEGEK